ncbi:MAG: hypothetical protein H7Y27_16165 [Gemmatimonadaceae bacterium]|nr:hypothetical protein [Chitinophagaceae bacterium]
MLKVVCSAYSIEFICGAFTAIIFDSVMAKKSLIPKSIVLVMLLVLCVSYPVFFSIFYDPNGKRLLIPCIVFGIFFSMLVFTLVTLETRHQMKFPAMLVRIGNVSYTIYLSHVLILGLLGRIWASYFSVPGMALDDIIAYAVMLLAIVSYSFIAFRLIENPSYKLFLGKRRQPSVATL